MSLADLAKQEGLKPSTRNTVADWFEANPHMVTEISDCRSKGYSWTVIHKLLRTHHGYPSAGWESVRGAMAKYEQPQDAR